MQHKKLIIIPILFLLFISPVLAQTQTDKTGVWDNSIYPNYAVSGANHNYQNLNGVINLTLGSFQFNNGTGAEFDVLINKLIGQRYQWWWTSGVKYVYFDLQLTHNGETVDSLLELAHEQGIIAQTGQVFFGTQQQDIFNLGGFQVYQNIINFTNYIAGIQILNMNNTAQIYYLAGFSSINST